jgi:carboxyl-terminal processing protease
LTITSRTSASRTCPTRWYGTKFRRVFRRRPLDAKVLTPLRQASTERQTKLDEFAFLRKNIEWFKARQEQKLISLNLTERQRQKAADDAFRKEMKKEKELIAKGDYHFKDFRLGPPVPTRIKAPKKDADEEEDSDTGDENDTYVKADVHLRETLRVVSDAIGLAANQDLRATSRAPLSAAKGG